MIIIPAIDIKDGKCVRLLQGEMDKETVFSDSPESMAKRWEEEGAEMLHVVDLNGAVEGQSKNSSIIKKIVASVSIPVQVGGGIRTREDIDTYFSLGVTKIILGTSAVTNPYFLKEVCELYPDKIIVGVDAKNGFVAVDGWTACIKKKADEFVKELEDSGTAGIIYTDIKRDGAMNGPNLKSIKMIAKSVSVPVIASGGISSHEDVKNVIALEKYGVSGMIIGRAIYTGAIVLSEAISLLS